MIELAAGGVLASEIVPRAAVGTNSALAWTAVSGAVISIALAGFALVETGLCRAKNVAHSMSMSFLVYPLALIAFFLCGFAFMCGGMGSSSAASNSTPLDAATSLSRLVSVGGDARSWGLVGMHGFALNGVGRGESLGWFLLMGLCASIAAVIPTGAAVERWRFKSFFVFSALVAGIVFPIFGCWMWGGGWLSQLGVNARLGHGAVDYAGSCTIHLLGGGAGLAAVIALGPRLGKYDSAMNPRPILGHHVPMVMLGTFLLCIGWFGLNCARSLIANDGRAVTIAVNTMICSAGAALAAALYMWGMYGRPDPSIICNGMLGGLVASSAGCAFFAPGAALLVGGVAGLLSALGVLFLERKGIDDPVGAISVHGLNGIWGTVAVGLFADGTFGNSFNGVAGAVTGLFYGGGSAQLVAQMIAVVVCAVWALGAAMGVFYGLSLLQGGNRVTPEIEIAGLDIPELGAPGYPEFINHVAPEQVPSSQILAARSRE